MTYPAFPKMLPHDGEAFFQEWFHTAEEARGMAQGSAKRAFTAGYWSREHENSIARDAVRDKQAQIVDLTEQNERLVQGLTEIQGTVESVEIQQELLEADGDARVRALCDIMNAVIAWKQDQVAFGVATGLDDLEDIIGWFKELTREEGNAHA